MKDVSLNGKPREISAQDASRNKFFGEIIQIVQTSKKRDG